MTFRTIKKEAGDEYDMLIVYPALSALDQNVRNQKSFV